VTVPVAQATRAPGGDVFAVRDLSVDFRLQAGLFGPGGKKVLRALQDVSINVRRGSCFAVVGESGSGKTTLARTLVGLVKPTSGQIVFDGVSVGELDGRAVRRLRRRVQMVMQDPRAAMDPRQRVAQILREALVVHGITRDHAEQQRRIEAVIQQVGLSAVHLDRYANQLSGGQRQRVAVARALILEPGLILLDEPTSALDASIQAEVLNLLDRLRAERGLTYVLVSHDLAVVAHMCDRLMVMQHGAAVEDLSRADLRARRARQDYTLRLLEASEGYRPEEAPARR
jgi:ABC-type glutathione transport system ATPase component